MAKKLRTKRDGRYGRKLFYREIRAGDLFLYGVCAEPHYIIEICSHNSASPYRNFRYRIVGYRAGGSKPTSNLGNFSSLASAPVSQAWQLTKPREVQGLLADKVFVSLT